MTITPQTKIDMDANALEHIVAEFAGRISQYDAFALVAKALIEQLLVDEGIRVHSLTHRTKSIASLREKLRRTDRNYTNLNDITDLAGVRVTTYFEPDVDRVSQIILEEFAVEVTKSVDKRDLIDPERFGYLSVHYVVSLSDRHSRSREYRRFAGLCLEIQIRSILQHAWAEIEHDLGYKSKQSVPKQIRRRFSRVAGLLEIADAEFAAIQAELLNYEREVGERIEREPERVGIDQASLTAFILSDSTVESLDQTIAAYAHVPLEANSQIQKSIKRLAFFHIESVEDLKQRLETRASTILAFAQRWLARQEALKGVGTLPVGVSIFYLAYVLAAESDDPAIVRSYLESAGLGAADIAQHILTTFRAVISTDPDESGGTAEPL